MSLFRQGEWLDRADRFVFCTSIATARTDHEREIETQTARLADDQVTFEVWDAEELSARLKPRPRIVWDFFGRGWVPVFCTEPFEDERRLDGEEIARLRTRLHDFYQRLFLRHDLLAENGATALRPIVVPDVLRTRQLGDRDEPGASRVPDAGLGDRDSRPPEELAHATETLLSERVSALDWISGERRCLLVGDAGTGKSTLIRWLCLDLLAAEPSTSGPQSSDGAFVAVWFPFGRWVAAIASGDRDMSFPVALQRFFEAYAAQDLWALVEAGLRDDRVVVLVDGLDEWSDETAAATAADRLQQFLFQRKLPAVAASREEGLRAFGLLDPEWATTRLAPLSPDQQTKFLATLSAATADAEALLAEVRAASRLRRLAENPLLLGLMWRLHSNGITLPNGAQAVLARFVRWLIETQAPARRRNAQVDNPLELDIDEVESALTALAVAMQEASAPGVSVADARSALSAFFTEHPTNGLNAAQARIQARTLLIEACGPIGVMSRLDGDHVIFNHRSIQEHLAGRGIARLEPADQQAVVRERVSDPAWANVIDALIWSSPNEHHADQLMRIVLDSAAGRPAKWNVMPTAAMIALGANHLSHGMRGEALRAVCDFVRSPDRLSARWPTLDTLIYGLDDHNVVTEAFQQWWPCVAEDRSQALNATQEWPNEEATVELWWSALADENTATARAAGRLLVSRFGESDAAATRLVSLLAQPLPSTTRAAMLDALSRGWPRDADLAPWIERAAGSPDPTLRLVALSHLVRNELHQDCHLPVALELANDWTHVDLAFVDELGQIITDGWPQDARVKDLVLETLDNGRHRPIGIGVATQIAILGFADDPDISEWVRRSAHEEHPFILISNVGWRSIGELYRDTDLLPDLEGILDRNLAVEINQFELALGLRTDHARDYLISALTNSTGFPTAGWPFGQLVAGWSDDPDVQAVLADFARSGSPRVPEVAHWLYDALPEAEASALLLELAQDRGNDRAGEALAALATRADPQLRSTAFEIGLGRIDEQPQHGIRISEVVLSRLSEDSRAIEIALNQLNSPEARRSLWAIAQAGRHHEEIREALRRTLLPLPAGLRRRLSQRLFERNSVGSLLVRQWDHEADALAASAAASAHAVRCEPEQRGNIVQEALAALQAPRLDNDGRAQSGLCALLDVGGVAEFAELTFSFDPARPLWVEFGVFKRNWWMGARVASHFDEITRSLGDQLLERFNSQNYPHAFWGTLAPFAANPGSLQDAVLAFIREQGIRQNAQLLRFLATVRPRSQELATVLASAVHGTITDRSEARTSLLLSAQVLASHFANDADVLAQLLAAQPITEGELLALAMGWRHSDAAVQTIRNALASRMRLSSDVKVRLSLLGSTPEQALEAFCSWLPEGEGQDWLVAPPTAAAVFRTTVDDEFASALKTRVRDPRSPSELGSGAKLLAAAGHLDAELRSFLEGRLSDALHGREVDAVGLDIFAEALQPLGWMLWDALFGLRFSADRS